MSKASKNSNSRLRPKSKLVNISDEMVSYILKNCTYYSEKTQVGSRWYIGYHHLTSRYENFPPISKSEAKELLISDIQKIENYSLLRTARTKLNPLLFDVGVHFAFDYGTRSLKNSQIALCLKTNNLDKCIDELAKYKAIHNSFETHLTHSRNFDIQILKQGCYSKPEVKNAKEQSTRRHVGFRY